MDLLFNKNTFSCGYLPLVCVCVCVCVFRSEVLCWVPPTSRTAASAKTSAETFSRDISHMFLLQTLVLKLEMCALEELRLLNVHVCECVCKRVCGYYTHTHTHAHLITHTHTHTNKTL